MPETETETIGLTLAEARALAEPLLAAMSPYCAQCYIAGSIRREKASGIKDVEIVAQPKIDTRTGENLLYSWAISDETQAEDDSPLQRWIKPGASEIIPWDVAPDGRYWRGLLKGNVKLDLFLSKPEAFGVVYLLRTGSREFSAGIAGHAWHTTPYRMQEGGLVRQEGGEIVPVPDEETLFRLLGLEFVPPQRRSSKSDVQRLRRAAPR